MVMCAKFDGRGIQDCTRGEGCICLAELKAAVMDKIDAGRWRKFERMPEADQKACLANNVLVTRQCVDDYEIR